MVDPPADLLGYGLCHLGIYRLIVDRVYTCGLTVRLDADTDIELAAVRCIIFKELPHYAFARGAQGLIVVADKKDGCGIDILKVLIIDLPVTMLLHILPDALGRLSALSGGLIEPVHVGLSDTVLGKACRQYHVHTLKIKVAKTCKETVGCRNGITHIAVRVDPYMRL